MASNEPPYVLTEEDLCLDGYEIPEFRAAAIPDTRILRAVLARPREPARYPLVRPTPANTYDDDDFRLTYQSPLVIAIKAQLPDNVRVLLDHGADPNGPRLSALTDYVRPFLRFQRPGYPADPISSQIVPITAQEIARRTERTQRTFNCFWKVSNNGPNYLYSGGDGITALEEACKLGSTEIFETILSASPDVSFWTTENPEIPDTFGTTPSSLSVANPLICAVKYHQTAHLRRLLDHDFNPNSMPMACSIRSFSPLMATLLCCNPPNWEAFSLLVSHPKINLELLTPLTRVHVLHFAVALISLDVLKRVLDSGFSLSTVMPTALGHTLLHVACLPPQISHVNIFMESIYQSACEFRHFEFAERERYFMFNENTPRPQPTDFFDAQAELVLYLLSESQDPDALIAAKDCHGNTALHYLAAYRILNWELMDKLIGFSEVSQRVYYDARNVWGWSAENLVRHGEVSESEIAPYKKFWKEHHAARIDGRGRLDILTSDE